MAQDKRSSDSKDDRLIVASTGLPRRIEDLSAEKLEKSGIAVKILGLAKVSGTYTRSSGLSEAVMRNGKDEVIMRIIPGPARGTVEIKDD